MKKSRSLSFINEHSIVEFNRYHFVLKNLLASGTMREEQFYYSSYPLICKTVRKAVNLIATDFSSLFEDDSADAGTRGIEASSGEGDATASREQCCRLGKLIQKLEYFTVQGDIITAVTSEQKFIREPIRSPLLKSLVAHMKQLLASATPAEAPGSIESAHQSVFPGAADIGSLPSSLTCRRCGRCCSLFEVIVTPCEIEQIASFLKISISEFRTDFLGAEPYTWSDHNALIRKSTPSGRTGKDRIRKCLFLREESRDMHCCEIYEVRPSVCRSYLPGTNLCRP
ncbi:MAG: YkgJ family cysteine cluster protein [Candidatus Xenobiia bacterium LiM19]